MKPRVLILYTGGTIGMEPSDRGYVPLRGFGRLLKEHLQARATHQLPDYELVELETLIDSANLTPSDWCRIGGEVIEQWDAYDGFVILHGTDTMAYTASALSFMLRGIDKPVILTGSQIPLTELRNDALDNLVTALMLAGDNRISEVCIFFDGRLLRGNRSTKLKSAGLDAFDSPNFPWLGQVGIHIDLQNNLLRPPGERDFRLPAYDPQAVTMVQIYPGISAQMIDSLLQPARVHGLILQTYGVGNPPNHNRELLRVLERAVERGKIIVNITQCIQGRIDQGAYATGSSLNSIGIIPGSDLTLEAAFTKLHTLLGTELDASSVRQAMKLSMCGECTDRS
ncbi:asparaginase [Sedimenticola sp.]|uniref:asparaginase n=2 Tax=Sedimenticola sp. TaxID=1940285 RepID=UPI003D0D7BB2